MSPYPFPFFRLIRTCAAVALCLPIASAYSGPKPDGPVLAEDFENASDSGLYAALAGHRLLEVVPGAGVDGGAALRAAYQGYDQGSRRIVLQYPLGASGTEFTLNYDVRFHEDFQFTRGGKLHGLAPENRVTGGNRVVPDGWSARVNFSGDGGVRTYLYSQRQDGTYGDSVGNGGFRFVKGRYHAVSLHLGLNDSADRVNGFARIHVDGELLVEHDDVQFRAVDTEASLISHLHISTFHGGNRPLWAPRDESGEYTTVYADFDNFAIYRGERVRTAPGRCWSE